MILVPETVWLTLLIERTQVLNSEIWIFMNLTKVV